MTEDERFDELGKHYAYVVSARYDVPITDDLIAKCREHQYRWFCAECSDDYNRTMQEQAEITQWFDKYIQEIKHGQHSEESNSGSS